jgi:hypothetical protein
MTGCATGGEPAKKSTSALEFHEVEMQFVISGLGKFCMNLSHKRKQQW